EANHKPKSTSAHKSCGYASTKWGKGRRSCDVRVTLTYEVKNYQESNSVIESISKLLSQTPVETDYFTSSNRLIAEKKQSLYQNIETKLSQNCHVQYVYIPSAQ